jgi:hypothetical protein
MTLAPAYPSGGVDGDAISPLTVNATGTTQSTSTSTGAIVTAGGVGIAKDVYVGGILAMSVGAVGTPSYTFAGDLNTGMWSSAADTLDFSAGGVRALQLTSVASAVNYFQLKGSTAGNYVTLAPAGSDSDIGVIITSKGALTTQIKTGNNSSFVEVESSFIRAGSSSTDRNLTLQSKGAGDVYLDTGTGVARFGTHSAVGAETISGYITIKDAAGNSRKLAVIS